MHTGVSSSTTARAAGREAASGAKAGDAALLVVLASPSLDPHEVMDGVADVAAGIPLIGCSTAGEITAAGARNGSVVVAALGGPGFSATTASADIVDGDTRSAGQKLAAQLVERADDGTILLLADALGGDQQQLVRGMYDVLGAGVQVVGGCAGDDLAMQRTTQFHDGKVLRDSVVGAVVHSDGPIGIGLSHGWRRTGEPMVVTQAEGTTILCLDDRPALDVYLEALDAPAAIIHDRAALTRFALRHPIGIERFRGEEIRFISGADPQRRSLECLATVPVGAVAHLMQGDEDSVLRATTSAGRQAVASLQGHAPIGAIAFDCIARKGVLEPGNVGTEVERLAAAIDAPIVGFYTYGEIARIEGPRGFHNQTLVVAAFG